MTTRHSTAPQIPCVLVMCAEEHRGDSDTGGNWTPRPRYDAYYELLLPFVPTKRTRFTNLLGKDANVCYVDDPEDEDDDFLGWKVDWVAWDCARQRFVARMSVELLIPAETLPENLPHLYPGWVFVLNEEASKGFEWRSSSAPE